MFRLADEAFMNPMRVAMEQIEREGKIMIASLGEVGVNLKTRNIARFPKMVKDLQVKLDAPLRREAWAG